MSSPEHPHRERERNERSRLQHAAEHTRPHRRVPLLTYLVVLFAAAFLLLLLSYFMQQRANQSTIDGLTTSSNSALQSLNNIIDQRDSLQEQVAALTEQIQQLERESQQLRFDLAQADQNQANQGSQLEAMDWFWRIQRETSRGQYNSARRLVEAFEATGLPASLPTTHPADAEGRSPAEQYQAILDLLN